jgi:hypothetical protein
LQGGNNLLTIAKNIVPFVESAEGVPKSTEELAAKGQFAVVSGDQLIELGGDEPTILSFWKLRSTLLIDET